MALEGKSTYELSLYPGIISESQWLWPEHVYFQGLDLGHMPIPVSVG